jgi:hypothetical protein
MRATLTTVMPFREREALFKDLTLGEILATMKHTPGQ